MRQRKNSSATIAVSGGKDRVMPKKTVTWVVYLMTIHKQTDRYKAVCEQSEWDAMELARPGYHHLVRGSIATEVEAEMLARRMSTPDARVAVVDQIVPAISGCGIRRLGD